MYGVIRFGKTACMCISLGAAALGVMVFGAIERGRASAQTADADSRELPVLMYHSVVNDSSLVGDYVITAEQLEADFIYLRDSGYTPVFCKELPDFTEGTGDLPEKPIVLTFDDGSYNNFYYVLPLLEKYGFKAVFAPVGEWTEAAAAEESPSPVYSYMDEENIRSCALSGLVEIADHTYSLHSIGERDGVLRRADESPEDYRRMLWSDLDRSRRIIEQACGELPVTLAYPYGFCSDESEQLARELGYKVTLGCEEKTNIIKRGDKDCLSRLHRFNRSAGRSAESFLSSD